MKKKLLTLLLATSLGLTVTACGGSEEPKKEDTKTESTDPSEPENKEDADKPVTGKVDKINMTNSEGSLVYTKHEVITDYDGNPAIRIYFDYTNTKDEPNSAQMTFYPKAFQNGVECEMAFVADENEASSNLSKEIQSGTTLNVAFEYELADSTNPVTLEVNDQSSENLFDDISQEQELALQ